jgi:hypothetical protein
LKARNYSLLKPKTKAGRNARDIVADGNEPRSTISPAPPAKGCALKAATIGRIT